MIGLRRGIEALELLASAPDGLSFNDLKNSLTGIGPSPLSRLLKTLLEENMIEQSLESKKYLLSGRAKKFASAAIGRQSISELLQPILKNLSIETGHSSAFFVYGGNRIVMTAKYEPEEAFHYMAIGKSNARFDAHGFAKLCFAYLPDKEKVEIYKNLSISEAVKKELEESLKKIREDGVLVNLIDDQQGLKRFVAPVFNRKNGEFAGSLGLSLFGDCSNPALRKRITEAVKRAASAASDTIM
jgi:DNA-binding IclR family transcriptional regulator